MKLELELVTTLTCNVKTKETCIITVKHIPNTQCWILQSWIQGDIILTEYYDDLDEVQIKAGELKVFIESKCY
jgi:hypothetical protein